MAPKLHKMDYSPPCRFVYLTAEALGIKLDYSEIDLKKLDQLDPAFLKLNPQHTIPTLEDDGKVIWDSHAISVYLFTKYAKDDSLYPKDLYKRAVVDQRFHFNSGTVFYLLRHIVRLMKYKGVKTISQELIDESIQAYEFLEKFLDGHQWIAGDQLTLADFCLLTSTTSLDVLVPINASKFPNVTAWIKRGQQLPYYHVNQKGLDDFRNVIKTLLA
ncbi:hypothetical protein ILUMI_04827 [Ignelater luminosus]|uniref:Glutathione S-transferase n=1 Tax=Ignelater luminosus TaxID=2038154 RepID=A0A8K0DBS1_IGNLU|nr:hypothetical protein ILUMI_04827 [Ignelater luminosus]